MKIAFPVKENQGLKSMIDDHFGTAPQFLIVDTNSRNVALVDNRKLTSGESGCKKGIFQESDQVDAVVTRCMGDGSRKLLTAANIKVYQAQKESVQENLDLFEKDQLQLFHIFDHCLTHKNKKEGGCGHHH